MMCSAATQPQLTKKQYKTLAALDNNVMKKLELNLFSYFYFKL